MDPRLGFATHVLLPQTDKESRLAQLFRCVSILHTLAECKNIVNASRMILNVLTAANWALISRTSWIVPGYALHEKGLQIQMGTVPLGNEERPPSRGLTARQPVVKRPMCSRSVYMGFRFGISFVRAFEESCRTVVFD